MAYSKKQDSYKILKDMLLKLRAVDKHSAPITGKTSLDVKKEYDLIPRFNNYSCNKSGQNTIHFF